MGADSAAPAVAADEEHVKDHRLILNRMPYRLFTAYGWRDLPERYGPWLTAAPRRRRWTRGALGSYPRRRSSGTSTACTTSIGNSRASTEHTSGRIASLRARGKHAGEPADQAMEGGITSAAINGDVLLLERHVSVLSETRQVPVEQEREGTEGVRHEVVDVRSFASSVSWRRSNRLGPSTAAIRPHGIPKIFSKSVSSTTPSTSAMNFSARIGTGRRCRCRVVIRLRSRGWLLRDCGIVLLAGQLP